jgi:predicted transcriptional regulator
MDEDPDLRRTLWFLLGGKRGGENRARIIASVREKPANLNQLATDLNLQYKTIQHHMKVLVSSSLVVASGDGYGSVYSLSPWFEAHIATFDLICTKLGLASSNGVRSV